MEREPLKPIATPDTYTLDAYLREEHGKILCSLCLSYYPSKPGQPDFEGKRKAVCDDCLETCKAILIERGEVQPVWRR